PEARRREPSAPAADLSPRRVEPAPRARAPPPPPATPRMPARAPRASPAYLADVRAAVTALEADGLRSLPTKAQLEKVDADLAAMEEKLAASRGLSAEADDLAASVRSLREAVADRIRETRKSRPFWRRGG
ncbi:MAG TPA: hypothetical protein VM889_04230, partial [Candidatus Thermoplasmatota archaeon]|nr:hypothetical protein [Candidatus Thermoplasmatota archaeon]